MDEQIDEAAGLSSPHSAILALRGHFSIPESQDQAIQLPPTLPYLSNAYPLSDEHAIVVSPTRTALLDAKRREVLWTIACPAHVSALSAPPHFLALAYGRQIFVWDVTVGQLLHTLESGVSDDDGVMDLTWSSDATLLAVALFGTGIQLWRVADGVLLHTLEVEDDCAGGRSVALSPDGHLVASGSFEDSAVWLWDVAEGRLVHRLEASPHGARVAGLAFSPDGHLLVCGDGGSMGDRTLMRVWDVQTGRALPGFPRTAWMPVFSADGRLLASTAISTKQPADPIYLWDVASRREVRRFDGHRGHVQSLAFSPSGRLLVSSAADGTVRWWTINTGQEVYRLEALLSTRASGAFNADTTLLATGTGEGKLRLWQTTTGTLLRTFQFADFQAEGVALSRTGRKVASWTQVPIFSGILQIWDTEQSGQPQRPRGPQRWIYCAAFSPNDLVIAAGYDDEQIRLWQFTPEHLLFACLGHTGRICCLRFSPTGGLLASGAADQTIRLWQSADGTLLRTLEGHEDGVLSVDFSPDERLLVSGSKDHTVRLWEVATGHVLDVFEMGQDMAVSVAFDAMGTRVAAGSRDRRVRLWEVGSLPAVFSERPGANEISQHAFALDGTPLPPESSHERILLWHLPQSVREYQLQEQDVQITNLAFRADGSLLIAGYGSGLTQLWRLEELER